MNPGSPAPQAGILDQARLRPPKIPAKQTELIVNTLLYLKNDGKKDNTIRTTNKKLNQIARHADLADPESVKTYIANALNTKTGKSLEDSSKAKFVFCYDKLCEANKITWNKPIYKYELKAPIIPTKDNVSKIISASTKRYATIFTILAETGAEGEELHGVHRNDIDTQQGIISIKGHKLHDSGNYKLKATSAEMLREYLAINPEEYPFPKPKVMGQIWVKVRKRIATNLNQPDLNKIPLKSLRNYSGAQLYHLTLDPIAVMRHLRHKKLETTMHYLRAIVTNGEEDYICKSAKTLEEDAQLIEAGFQFVTERDGVKLFRKRK